MVAALFTQSSNHSTQTSTRCATCVTSSPLQGCTAFNYLASGVCELHTGTIAGAIPTRGAVGGLPAPNTTGCNPTIALLSPGNSLQSVMARPAAAGLSWQQVCCFNRLATCGVQPNATAIVLPCPSPTLSTTCAAADATTSTTIATASGCSCRTDYTVTADNTTRRVSNGCISGGQDPVQQRGPWCVVDPASCATGLLTNVGGQPIATCSGNGQQLGCDLLTDIALGSAAGALNRGANTTVASVGQCCSLCSLTPLCAAFTFLPRGNGGGDCWLRPDVAGGTKVPGAVSGINRAPLTDVTPARRRALLQQSPTCPKVFALPDGQAVNATKDFGVDGVSWQQVCFDLVSCCSFSR